MTKLYLVFVQISISFVALMKQVFTIFLALLLLLTSVRDLVTFTAFKLNQEEIATQFCVNIDEPIPMCYGQCFLDAQIELNKQNGPVSDHLSSIELHEKTVYFQLSFLAETVISSTSFMENSFLYQELISANFLNDIFHPPSYSA